MLFKMYTFQFVLIYCVAFKICALDDSLENCFNSYGSWYESPIIKREYTYLSIPYVRYLKWSCAVSSLTILWRKDGILIKREKKAKNRKRINSVLKFYSLSQKDTGNYTIYVINDKYNFTFTVELIVTEASSQLKTIRQNTIPFSSTDVTEGQLYWMPKMTEINSVETISSYDEFSLSCWLCSTKSVTNNSVRWSLARPWLQPFDKEDSLLFNSRIKTTFTETECQYDDWMPKFEGHCYVTNLHFSPFLSTDSGTYSCNINNSLNNPFLLLDQMNSLPKIVDTTNDNVLDITTKNILTFNSNETVCVGSRYFLNCLSKFTNKNLSLWFINDSGNLHQHASSNSWNVYYNISYVRVSDSGEYICREDSDSEMHMFLNVTKCFPLRFPLLVVLSFIAPAIVLTALMLYCLHVRSNRKSYLNNKIHSITKLKAENMHRNERYIPLVQDIDLEIPRDNVTLSTEVLGAGEFGTVFKGTLRNKQVAIKVANADGNDMLVQEIKVMKQIGYHQHVIKLLGICSWNDPLMAILDLADGGNLRQHLRDHNPILRPSCEQIGLEQLLSYVTQIASGMQYLASKHVIHRDLAARNCLLTNERCIKLSDFGMTRVAVNYYHKESQDVKAIAWVAPEAISGNIFTSKSDVWSFGIVMWEVFELGACPYPSLSSSEIIEAVNQRIVNSQPALASDAIFAIMTRCWSFEANNRPTFSELKEYLDEVDVNEYL